MILYSTDGCHLCEEAEQLLIDVRSAVPGLAWKVVDIADDDALFERYGWSIPVVADDRGRELRWPFDAAALRAFVDGS
jgi:hypothetical protein